MLTHYHNQLMQRCNLMLHSKDVRLEEYYVWLLLQTAAQVLQFC